MTHTLYTPPPAAAVGLRPFAHDPERWTAERSSAFRNGHARTDDCRRCEPVLVHERTSWGWLTWTVPADGRLPELPHQIGILPPAATRIQRLGVRWLTRRPARRIGLAASIPGSLRLSAAVLGLVGCFAALLAISHDVPTDIALVSVALVTVLADHLPDRLDDRVRRHARVVEAKTATRYMQRLAAWHTHLVRAASGSERHELLRAVEIGQHLLWDTADLLLRQDPRRVSSRLIARERLLVQLAAQVGQILTPNQPESTSSGADSGPPNLRTADQPPTAPARFGGMTHSPYPLNASPPEGA
ncbi:hypothetical protein [Streptomyces sp. NPDC059909]|uniref:hypothetical protein n=1 Tax=Streptomyces sp. NPDC059909 TaxID=3346998 RepID=UPI00365D9F20